MSGLHTDVLIVGGGTAGAMASLAAADEGARVIVVEADSAAGGIGTRGGIHCYYYGTQGGVQNRVDEALGDRGRFFGEKCIGFHPEAKRTTLAEMLNRAGVQVIFNGVVAQVLLEEGCVVGAIVETDEETLHIHARVTVDSTGNGDVAFLAGVPCRYGRGWDGLYHAYSLAPRSIEGHGGGLSFLNIDAGWVDSADIWDFTRGYIEGRDHLWRLWNNGKAKRYIALPTQLGIREGRYIQGDYTLQLQDLILDRRFEDVVMRCYSHYDNHAGDYANESELAQIWVCVLGLWKQAIGGDIPYRCFLPSGVEGLLIACRALSLDHDAGIALRMQRDIQKVGEVAGVAAAIAVKEGLTPRSLDVHQLQERLIARGVILQEDLSRPSTPWVIPGDKNREARPWTLESASSSERIKELITYLGTDDEGKALYWLWISGRGGGVVADLLKGELNATEYRRRRGAALALALLGSDDGVDILVQSIAQRDGDSLPGYRVPPRWIASLVALKILRNSGAIGHAIDILEHETQAEYLLFALHYLISVVDRCSLEEQRQITAAIEALLHSRPNAGEGYILPGGIETTLRWSIQLATGYLLVACGHPEGLKVIEGYLEDLKGYVRGAARRVLARINPSVSISRETEEAQPARGVE